MTVAVNLATGERRTFTCGPRQAAITAHAQERHDWNTWNYELIYGGLVQESASFVTCGDWTAEREGNE